MTDRRDFFKISAVSAGGMLLGNCAKTEVQLNLSSDILSNIEKEQVIYNELSPIAKKMVSHSHFKNACSKLNFKSLNAEFNNFKINIKRYNDFHRMERRLWALKIGNKPIVNFEADFKAALPNAILNYQAAFNAISKILSMLETSGFDKVVNNCFPDLCGLLGDEKANLRNALVGFFTDLGCSREMIAEFKSEFSKIDYNFADMCSNNILKLKDITEQSVHAQVSILEYSQEYGMSYLRGKCGPPSWAVIVSEILNWAGISISAWVVVATIATLIPVLVSICKLNYSNLPDEIKILCDDPAVVDLWRW